MIIEIKNEHLAVKINTLGAEIKSIKTNGEERLHQPNEIWEDQSPVLFPICGTPTGNKITVDGVDYPMTAHGFAMFSEFELVNQTETSATFLLVSSAETKKSYPYDFEFYVTYTLDESSIDVCYEVKNKSIGAMYFSVGCHEGYLCPEGLSAYELHFEKAEPKNPFICEGRRPIENGFSIVDGHSVHKLTDELFTDSITVVYDSPVSEYVILKNTLSGRETKIYFKDFDHLLMWTEPGADFVCIEPWCGMSQFGLPCRDISEKNGIHKLEETGTYSVHHIITF